MEDSPEKSFLVARMEISISIQPLNLAKKPQTFRRVTGKLSQRATPDLGPKWVYFVPKREIISLKLPQTGNGRTRNKTSWHVLEQRTSEISESWCLKQKNRDEFPSSGSTGRTHFQSFYYILNHNLISWRDRDLSILTNRASKTLVFMRGVGKENANCQLLSTRAKISIEHFQSLSRELITLLI